MLQDIRSGENGAARGAFALRSAGLRLPEWHLVRGTYDTLLPVVQSPDWIIRLTDWLAYNGYRVVMKSARVFRQRFRDAHGEEHWTSKPRVPGHRAGG